jgi:hypothetical protein
MRSWHFLLCSGEQDRDIERHRHRADLGREHRRRNVMSVGAHHDRRLHGRTVENHLTVMPNNSQRAVQMIRFRKDTLAFLRVMIQQAKAMAELAQMLWTRICQCNPSATGFGEALTRLWPNGGEKIPGLRAGMIAGAPAVFAKYGIISPLLVAHVMAQGSLECGAGNEVIEDLRPRRIRTARKTHRARSRQSPRAAARPAPFPGMRRSQFHPARLPSVRQGG